MNEQLNIAPDIQKSASNKELGFLNDGSKIWFEYLIKHWLLIFILCAAGGLAGFVYSKNQVILYESYLTFSLDDGVNSGGAARFSSLAAQFGLSPGDNNLFSGDNILEVITSRKILERTLLSVDTINGKLYTFIDFLNGFSTSPGLSRQSNNTRYPPGLDRKNFSYTQDSLLYFTYLNIRDKYLSASRPDKKLNIYEIKFRSPEERFTKVFTEKILAETIRFYTELKSKKSKETLDVLEQRISSLKENINSSISSKALTQDANINPSFAASQVPLQKQQMNIQVFSGAYAEIYKNLEFARFEFLQNIPLVQIIDGVNYPMNRIKPNAVKNAFIWSLITFIFAVALLTIFHPLLKRKKHSLV